MSEGWPDFWIKGKYIELIDTINTINLIKQVEQIDNITNLGTLDTINTVGTIQKINPTETENVVIDRIAKIDEVTNLGTLDTLNTVGTIQKINPQNTDNVVIDRVKTINLIETINTLDTINTVSTVNTIDTINKIRDVTISEERRRDAIKNGFFNQALTGWYVDYVEIQDTDDPYFIAGYDAVLTSSDSNLIQYLIPFMRKDEVHSLQIRCKGAASGDLQIMFINPSGGSSAYPLSISDSYATYTVDIPYDIVACIWIMPADASIIPCRIKFISAPLKTKVYQAEKDRTISREGSITHFNVSASAAGSTTVYTPSSGKKAKVLAWNFYVDADVICELRFSNSGNVIAGLSSKGATAMNLIGCNAPTGDTDETIEIYVSDAANVKGWINIVEV